LIRNVIYTTINFEWSITEFLFIYYHHTSVWTWSLKKKRVFEHDISFLFDGYYPNIAFDYREVFLYISKKVTQTKEMVCQQWISLNDKGFVALRMRG